MAKSILSDLYNGEIIPVESIPADSNDYQQQDATTHKAFLNLYSKLSEEQQALLESYLECRFKASKIELESTFAEGFKIGAKIILEIVSGHSPAIQNLTILIKEANRNDSDNNLK